MFVYAPHANNEKGIRSQELEEHMAASCRVGGGNQTWILWKISKC